MPDYEAIVTDLIEKNEKLQRKCDGLEQSFFTARTQLKAWKEKCAILLETNTKLERQIKAIKKEEAKKLSGFLKLGSDHQPIIDRTYKGK